MQDIIIIAIILGIITAVIFYIYRAKKRGEHCIGCPYSGQCGKSSPDADAVSACSADHAGCTGSACCACSAGCTSCACSAGSACSADPTGHGAA